MATPTPTVYSVASGATVYGGRSSPARLLAGAIGDSTMAHAGGWSPLYWLNGLADAPLVLLTNSGFNGQNILGLSTQIDNLYTEPNGPGFAGLPYLDVSLCRVGANAARGAQGSTGVPLDSSNETNYLTLIGKLKDRSNKVILLPVMPIGGSVYQKNTAVVTYNNFLQNVVAGDVSGQLFYLNDCSAVVDGSGNILPQFFLDDELHAAPAGTLQMGITGYPGMLAIIGGSKASPLVTNAADVYPAQPQWNPNPTNVGTGGTFGTGWSGMAPNGMRVENNGAGGVGTVSIVAADVGDANQVPWVRITPSTAAVGCNVSISFPGAGRVIVEADPVTLEQLLDVRVNNMTVYGGINAWAQAGGARFTETGVLAWSPTLGVNRHVILAQKFRRANPTLSSGATSTCYIYLGGVLSNFTGNMGSFDFRCFSIRG